MCLMTSFLVVPSAHIMCILYLRPLLLVHVFTLLHNKSDTLEFLNLYINLRIMYYVIILMYYCIIMQYFNSSLFTPSSHTNTQSRFLLLIYTINICLDLLTHLSVRYLAILFSISNLTSGIIFLWPEGYK